MRYVRIVVDGITYTLQQNANGEWTVTNKAPYVSGEYQIAVLATTEQGQELQLEVDDPELYRALTLIVTEGDTVSGKRMIDYYPEAIQRILEFQALINSEGYEVDFLKSGVSICVNEAYLTTMSEERISEWEKVLGISNIGDESIEDRRDVIIARIRGQGKLNTTLINSIVNAFTKGTAQSYIKDSVLYVKVTPPPNNKQYRFENVAKEIGKKIPAHLGLSVKRNYSTWGEIAENFSDWAAVNSLGSWEDLSLYISPQ